MVEILSAKQGEELVRERIALEVERRWQDVYLPATPLPSDDPDTKALKFEFLLNKLHYYAENTVEFVRDNGWVMDTRDEFGQTAVRQDLVPRGMVPTLIYPKQEELLLKLDECLDEGRDFVGLKSRQVAATYFFELWAIHKWLFRPTTHGVLMTYKEDRIDTGGKGERSPNTLFGRLRIMLDAFAWCYSYAGQMPSIIRFNQQWEAVVARVKQGRQIMKKKPPPNGEPGMSDSEDRAFSLTRPRWQIAQRDIFEGARGNTLLGDTASESTARAATPTYVFADELAIYPTVKKRSDYAFWNASTVNVKLRVGLSTITPGGGQGTLHHELMEKTPEGPALTKWRCHWSELMAYRFGMKWRCLDCDPDQEPWDEPTYNRLEIRWTVGDKGRVETCNGCGREKQVMPRDLWSPWFAKQCAKMRYDKLAIACELQMDWLAAQGDRFFAPWDGATSIVPCKPEGDWLAFDGFDPGYSTENPAAWVAAMFDPKTRRPHIIGYWMAANAFIEYWVPFFKRWSAERTKRTVIQAGKFAGMTFRQAFSYSDDAYRMMDFVSDFPMGERWGDKFGSHRTGTESPYDVLSTKWGVHVNWRYTADREVLCQQGITWSARTRIDPRIVDMTPMSPLNRPYPSIREVFGSAKPRPHSGQGVYRIDVDKDDPPHMSHAVDAFLYMTIPWGEDVTASVDVSGNYSVNAESRENAVVEFGDLGLGF